MKHRDNGDDERWRGKRYLCLARQSNDAEGTTSTQAQLKWMRKESDGLGMHHAGDDYALEGVTGALPGRRKDLQEIPRSQADEERLRRACRPADGPFDARGTSPNCRPSETMSPNGSSASFACWWMTTRQTPSPNSSDFEPSAANSTAASPSCRSAKPVTMRTPTSSPTGYSPTSSALENFARSFADDQAPAVRGVRRAGRVRPRDPRRRGLAPHSAFDGN